MRAVTKISRVIDKVTEWIVSGHLRPQDKLPTERELAETLGCSRETVREAMHRLAEAGLIAPRQGSGWYVRERHRMRFPLHTIDARRVDAPADVWETFLEAQGRTAGARLTVTSPVAPPDHIRKKLHLPPDGQVACRHRIRLADGEPSMISVAWWPLWLAKGTPIERPESCSPLSLAIGLGHGQVYSEAEIGSRMPTRAEASTLSTGRGVPVMEMYTVGRDASGRPIRCTVDVFPAHRFVLVVDRKWSVEQ